MRHLVRLDDGARLDVFDLARLPVDIAFSEADAETSRNWQRKLTRLERFVAKITRHKVGPKHGSAWSPAIFSGQSRKGAEAVQVSLGVFDCDRGQPLSEIRAALLVRGYAALIVSSHSHGATKTVVTRSKWHDWQEANPNGTAADFMRQHGYHESVASGAIVA